MSPDAIKLAVAKSPSALITVREIEGGPPQYFGHASPRSSEKVVTSYKSTKPRVFSRQGLSKANIQGDVSFQDEAKFLH